MPSSPAWVTFLLAALVGCTTPTAERKLPPEIAAYRQAFDDAVGSRFIGECDQQQMLAQITAARVLWLGDVHTNSRLHALQSELLTELQRQGIKLVLALEAIGTQDEARVQQFLEADEKQVAMERDIKRRWPESWLSDLSLDPFFYRGLLAMAKRYGWPVRGLEPTPRAPLAQRDEIIARSVQAAAAAHPDRLVVAIVGQAHLLGQGDLVRRTGLPAVAFGGLPPSTLRVQAQEDLRRNRFLRSNGDLWWFVEICRIPD
jgi:hypothetical protein